MEVVQPVARQAVRADQRSAWAQYPQRLREDLVLKGAGWDVVQHGEHANRVERGVRIAERRRVAGDRLDVRPAEPVLQRRSGRRVEFERDQAADSMP